MTVLLFDIDGTLLSSGGAGKAAMESALLGEFGLPAVTARVTYSGRTDRAIGRDLLHEHGVPATEDNLQRLHLAYLRNLPQFLHSHPGRVLPGIAELMCELAGRPGVAVGLLTGNIRNGARLKLGHYGLDHHFAFGGFGDQHWERDDVAREAFQAAARHLNRTIDPGKVWVIGDTPLDVCCARSIGAKVIAVATGWHPLEELRGCGPDVLLPDLSDVAELLGRWN